MPSTFADCMSFIWEVETVYFMCCMGVAYALRWSLFVFALFRILTHGVNTKQQQKNIREIALECSFDTPTKELFRENNHWLLLAS